MRNLGQLAFLVPVLCLAAACEVATSSGGTSTPDPGATFDGGNTPGPGGDTVRNDAGADATIPQTGLTVVVVDGTSPVASVRVITHDAGGAVTADLKTDAMGKLFVAAAPAMVTILAAGGAITYGGIAEGDSLLVNVADPIQEPPTPAGSFTLSFGPPLAGATAYAAGTSGDCLAFATDPSRPLVLDLLSTCVRNQNAVLVKATSERGETTLGFGFAKGLAKPVANGTVNVGPIAFTAKGETMVAATNIPAEASSFANLYAIASEGLFAPRNVAGDLTTGGLVFETATGFADTYQAAATVQQYGNGGSQVRSFVRREATTAPATLTLAFDFATSLPAVTNAVLTAPPPAPSRPEMTLSTAAPLTATDGAVVAIGWSSLGRKAGPRWTFVLPPTTTFFKAPALPADVPAEFVPGDDVQVSYVAFVEATQLPGFKELKALPSSPSGLGLLDEEAPLPGVGTLRISRWAPAIF